MDAIDNILGQHYNNVALCFYQNGYRGPITRQRVIELLSGPQGESLTNQLFYATRTASYVEDPAQLNRKKQEFTQSILRALYMALGIEFDDEETLSPEEIKKEREREMLRTFAIVILLLGIAYAIIKS